MKPHLLIVVVLASVSLSFGQTPPASPTPMQSASPQKTRAKTFGSSLEKYKRKGQGNSPNKQNSDELNDGDTIRVTTDLVMNDVLVTEKKAR